MKTQLSFGLWDHAAFGPLVVPVVASMAGAATAAAASSLLSPKGKAPAPVKAPAPPRPAQPMSSGQSSFFGPQSGMMGGTFVTGRAGTPNLGSSGQGKKTLLGA